MSRKIQPVSIDGIEFDALISSNENHTSDVPQYPVEDGYEIGDTIINKSLSLEITVYVSNTPVTHLQRFGGAEGCKFRIDDVVSRLEKMRAERKLVTIATNDKTYKNMALESMSISKSLEVGYARQIPLSFKEVIITSTETVAVPAEYGKSGKTGAYAGTAVISESNVSKSSPQSNKSILKEAKDAIVESIIQG